MEKELTIEIAKGSNIKYEVGDNGQVFVDRILYGTEVYPQNYGFFPNTLDWDGDPLDGLLISNNALMTSSICKIRILGELEMIDGGEIDTKIIGVIAVDPRFNEYKSLKDLPKHYLDEIKNFFQNYKILQNKTVVVNKFNDQAGAIKTFEECTELFQKYGDLNKEDFIHKMKSLHPEKY